MWKAQYSMEEAKAFAEATLDTLPVYAAINPTNQTAASRKEIESWQKYRMDYMFILKLQ